MKICQDSKKIIEDRLNEAVKKGDLLRDTTINDTEFTKILGFESEKYLIVCIQYLKEKHLITSRKEADQRHLSLCANAIDFLEQD